MILIVSFCSISLKSLKTIFWVYVNNLTPLEIMKGEGTKKTVLVWILPYRNEYFSYLQ